MAARKRFGQHFLEPAWVAKVIAAIEPGTDDDFVEIGPGRAALTTPLASKARTVTAFEIDRDLAAELRASAPPNLTVVEGDFLESDWLIKHRPAYPIRVAGNLPYNVASPILFRLIDIFDSGIPLADATLMLQREVVDRLLARPGTKEYGVLSVLVRLSADVVRLLNLPAGAFRPVPRVQSALVRLRFHPPAPAPHHRPLFTNLVQAVFTRRRKTIENALQAFRPDTRTQIAAVLARAQIETRRRPETLDIAELVRLADAFSSLPTRPPAVL
jgi:16S rRNA (adenine1518-N6/adenine1519-N6)-dimethyltransferase